MFLVARATTCASSTTLCLLHSLAKLAVMSKAYRTQDNIVKGIPCDKLGPKSKEISRQICMKPVTVQSLVVKFEFCGDREIPRHLLADDGVRRSVAGLCLTQEVNFIVVDAMCELKPCH